MVLTLLALFFAFTIAFGRQSAVFGKVKAALWFFSNFEKKRILFTVISLIFGALSVLQNEPSVGQKWMLVFAIIFILFSFFFDMKYFFPEIYQVEKSLPNNIHPDTLIFGLDVDKMSIAYPLNEVVIPRHIINDKLGDRHVLISYCALCQSALAFSANLGDVNLYFKVAGVWRRNMIIYDTKTHSLWQQATGKCIYGKMKGSQLTLLSGENTTMNAWRKKYPNTFFASKCIEARKGYLSRELMLKGLNFITPKVTVPGYSDLSGLPERETVFGITYNGISKAYPMSAVLNLNKFTDDYNGKSVTLHYNSEANYLTAKTVDTNKELIVERHWWLGWKEFHPETKIWVK